VRLLRRLRRDNSCSRRCSNFLKLPTTPRMKSCFSPTPSSDRLMITWLLGHDRAMRSTLSGIVGKIPLVGMVMTPGRQCSYTNWASSTTCGYISGSPPLIVNQYGVWPREANTLSHSSRVSSSSRFIQILQVRQRELHLGEGERVRLSGSIRGQPNRRYSLKSGTRSKTPAIEFMPPLSPDLEIFRCLGDFPDG